MRVCQIAAISALAAAGVGLPTVARANPAPPGIATATQAAPDPAVDAHGVATSAEAATAGPAPQAAASYSELPTGREVAPTRARPTLAEAPVRACSFLEPVCVHAPQATAPASLLVTLRGAERAMGVFDALGFPRPLPDGDLGGDGAFDLYLLPGADAETTVDPIAACDVHDSASAFAVLPPTPPEAWCEGAMAAARAVAHAMILRIDAGAEAGATVMASSYLAHLAAGPCPLEVTLVDDAQRSPELALVAGGPSDLRGSLLFPWYLDEALGAGPPGATILGLLTLATQKTPPGSWAWRNEPDVFDALRATMRIRGSSLDQLLLDFAVARAFLGSRSDGAHLLLDTERFGDLGRVRFEWAVPYASLPRRLAPARPVDPTGATYLWLDLAGAPPGAALTFAADWELPSLFRWSLVKIDPQGGEAGRVEVAGVYGSSHAERTVVDLAGLAGILVVGTNAGSVDRSHPFDPDEPYDPHGYTVTLAK